MSVSQYDDQKQTDKNLKTALAESHLIVRNLLMDIEAADIDPNAVRLPDNMRQRELVKNLHSAILDYRSFFTPVNDAWSGYWDEELYTVSDPLLAGVTISLSSLDQWRMRYQSQTSRVNDPVEGETISTNRYRVVIPPLAAFKCYEQLNSLRHELKLWFEPEEKDITELDDPIEVFDPNP